ncbi:MAG: M28 family metallopeptidase [Planctomycetota bacterium]
MAQPRLKGRPSGSWESQIVRDYLTERLALYGCRPWAENESFELPFSFGTNVIGVLPGTDPQLADEIVLISAHYDHLKPGWFSYYPGASDNASAVAVVLEIAEKLSRCEHRPKRSICFAFFDAEEKFCLGSFAFTSRDDYVDDDIAAVINLDLLGRDLLDVVDNSLIVTGTEYYGPLQSQIAATCSQHTLQLIPFETALVGPVGDHAAFMPAERPVLFFSCGIYQDYHQTTDTPEKLNYEKLHREGAVVEKTLLALANAEPDTLKRSPAPITSVNTDSFAYILNRFKNNAETLKLDPNDIQQLDQLIVKVNTVDPNTTSRAELIAFERSGIRDLLKLLDDYNPTLAYYGDWFMHWSQFYAINPEGITQAGREVIEHYLSHKPSLFSSNEFIYRDGLPIAQDSWGITQLENGQFFFGFVDVEMALGNKLQLLTGHSFNIEMSYKLSTFQGSLANILDQAILGTVTDPNNFRGMYYGRYGQEENKPAPDSKNNLTVRKQALYATMLKTIGQQYPDELTAPELEKYQELSRLMSQPDPNETTHSLFLEPNDCMKKGKAKKKQKPDPARQEQEWIKRLNNIKNPVDFRVSAITPLANRKTYTSLTALVEAMDDTTPYQLEPQIILQDDFPLRYHPIVSQMAEERKDKEEKYGGKTLGQIAGEKLKEITGQDFADEKTKWQQWIQNHYKQ